jgi:tRNA-dihydrouridine synthase B
MQIGNLNLKGRVLLAPLAGVSNRPFRVLAIRSGAALTYTEMISSEGIIRDHPRTLAMMAFGPDERPIGIQLFGANPDSMQKAAEIAVNRFQPDLVDINFGCPVRKVVNKNGGAAVLKDLRLTEEIIRGVVVGAGRTPVTVKIRTGWDDKSPVFLRVGEIAESAGVAGICLHARSRSGGYAGKADWSAIKALKDAVGIPVIGNGDVLTPLDAARMFTETGCDAVMIGRATMGNPLIFRQINEYLDTGLVPDEPTVTELMKTACLHARLMAETFGEERGIRMMRRYLTWYVRGFRGAPELRRALTQVSTVAEIEAALKAASPASGT